MLRTVVNLTQQQLIGEIESALDTYPYHPYQQAFAIPDLRQELVSYVLNRIPCDYGITNEHKVPLLNYKFHRGCLEEQLQIQSLIQQGIYSILEENSDWAISHLPKTVQCSFEPSHWFG